MRGEPGGLLRVLEEHEQRPILTAVAEHGPDTGCGRHRLGPDLADPAREAVRRGLGRLRDAHAVCEARAGHGAPPARHATGSPSPPVARRTASAPACPAGAEIEPRSARRPRSSGAVKRCTPKVQPRIERHCGYGPERLHGWVTLPTAAADGARPPELRAPVPST